MYVYIVFASSGIQDMFLFCKVVDREGKLGSGWGCHEMEKGPWRRIVLVLTSLWSCSTFLTL